MMRCNYPDGSPHFSRLSKLSLSPLPLGGRGHAPVDHGPKRMREKLSVQDPQRVVARLRRPPTQTFARAHVLHPPEVTAPTITTTFHRRGRALSLELPSFPSNLTRCNRTSVCWRQGNQSTGESEMLTAICRKSVKAYLEFYLFF